MKFTKTKLEGVYVIDIEKIEDERGFFARTWDKIPLPRIYPHPATNLTKLTI